MEELKMTDDQMTDDQMIDNQVIDNQVIDNQISKEQLQKNLQEEYKEILYGLDCELYENEQSIKEDQKNSREEKEFIIDLNRLKRELFSPKPLKKYIEAVFDRYSNDPKRLHEIGKAIYFSELINNVSIMKPNPPYNSLTKKILLERAKNYNDYIKYSHNLIVDKLLNGYDYEKKLGIPSHLKLSDLLKPNDNLGRISVSTAYNLSDDLLIKLLTCKKDVLVPSRTIVKDDHISTGTFYIGKVDNKDIVFYERLYRNNEGIGNSYYLCCLVGGKLTMKIPLIRGDYNPDINHYNKTKNWNHLPEEYFKDEPSLHDQEIDARAKVDEKINKIKKAISTREYNLNILKENKKLHKDNNILNNLDKNILRIESEIKKYKKLLNEAYLIQPYSHIHINRQFYSVLFPKQANGMDVHYLSHNQIFNNKIETYKDYLERNKIRDYEGFIDNIDRMSTEELNTFGKFIYFLRESSGIDLNKNKQLLDPNIQNVEKENYVCSSYIPKLSVANSNDFNITSEYTKFLKQRKHNQNINEELVK